MIEAVGALAGLAGDLPRLDGSGSTLLPGLIDAHTHTREVAQLRRALRFGVTTVLDMFTIPAAEPASTFTRPPGATLMLPGFRSR